jgi:hypothetical protein
MIALTTDMREMDLASRILPNAGSPYRIKAAHLSGNALSSLIRAGCRVIPSATRLHSPGSVDRSAPNHSLLITRASRFLPANNPIPEAPWIDLQRVAHLLEREGPVSAVFENPQPSFPEFLLPGRMMCSEIALKTSQRIDKDAGHQTHDRLE